MTHKTALRKLDHAIEYLKARSGRIVPFVVRDGSIVDNVRLADHLAMLQLANAMCAVVKEVVR